MVKVINIENTKYLKEKKKMLKQIDEAFKRNCLICNQEMEFFEGLVWYCKRCDTLTYIKNITYFDNGSSKRDRFIEYE